MYPYNICRPQTNITAKERIQQKNPDLSTDRRLQELLFLAQKESRQLEQKYTALLQEEALKEANEIIRTMETDTKKHQRILKELLFIIFSDTVEDILEEITETQTDFLDTENLLEELLLTEMDDITFYRNLLFAIGMGNHSDDDLWNLLFEILTDKQNHTAALNHLYAKYFAKNTGQ